MNEVSSSRKAYILPLGPAIQNWVMVVLYLMRESCLKVFATELDAKDCLRESAKLEQESELPISKEQVSFVTGPLLSGTEMNMLHDSS